jgi:UDP-N-acetylglucosamine pyrophosphorylase
LYSFFCSNECGPDGNLLFCNASIASIMFTRKAIQQAIANAHDLPWHLAEGKSVACNARMAAAMGVSQGSKPGKVEATKCELFIFDAYPYVQGIGAVRGLREQEFAPVKNGNDVS